MTFKLNGPPMAVRALPPAHQQRLARTVLELRCDLKLSYSAISRVLDLYEGVELSPDLVRHWCRSLGVPPTTGRERQTRNLLYQKVPA